MSTECDNSQTGTTRAEYITYYTTLQHKCSYTCKTDSPNYVTTQHMMCTSHPVVYTNPDSFTGDNMHAPESRYSSRSGLTDENAYNWLAARRFTAFTTLVYYNTTQYTTATVLTMMRAHSRSPNPMVTTATTTIQRDTTASSTPSPTGGQRNRKCGLKPPQFPTPEQTSQLFCSPGLPSNKPAT